MGSEVSESHDAPGKAKKKMVRFDLHPGVVVENLMDPDSLRLQLLHDIP